MIEDGEAFISVILLPSLIILPSSFSDRPSQFRNPRSAIPLRYGLRLAGMWSFAKSSGSHPVPMVNPRQTPFSRFKKTVAASV